MKESKFYDLYDSNMHFGKQKTEFGAIFKVDLSENKTPRLILSAGFFSHFLSH